MGNQVEQWPWTGAGTIDLLRMSSQAGVTVAKPKRVPGAEVRDLVLRGVIALGPDRSGVPAGMRVSGRAVVPRDDLPYDLRWRTNCLALVEPGPLHKMLRASTKESVLRQVQGLPDEGFGTRIRRNLKEEFTGPADPLVPLPTQRDEARGLMGQGLVEWTEVRWLKVIKTKERKRTALGDEWAVRGAELVDRLRRLAALAAGDPHAAAALVQSAGGLVAVLPGMFGPALQVAAAVPPVHRPVAVGSATAFDVLGGVEAMPRAAFGDRSAHDAAGLPDLFELIGKAYDLSTSDSSSS